MKKDADKGTDELIDMKNEVFTICRKSYISLRVSIKYIQDSLNLIVGFKKQHFILFIHNSINNFLKIILNIKTRNCTQRLLYRFMNNLSRENMKKGSNMITQSEEPAPEEIEVCKHLSDIYCLSAVMGDTGLIGEK